MISISEEAKIYLLNAIKKQNGIGISVDVVKGGCSGMQFKFSIEKTEPKCEKILIENNLYFFIKNTALLFVIGSTLIYKKTMTGGMLIFQNPNLNKKCECGLSFSN